MKRLLPILTMLSLDAGILLGLSASYGDPGKEKPQAKWVVEKNSSLGIHGETNVNRFQCDVTEYIHADTFLISGNDAAKKLWFTNSTLRIDIRRFDCHNKFITSDFRSALKADESPELKIRFLYIDQFPTPCNNQQVKGLVEIELARVTKKAEISYTVKTTSGSRVQLNGTHVFTFSDFKLKTPKKLAGLIRTRDSIRVNFDLFFKTI